MAFFVTRVSNVTLKVARNVCVDFQLCVRNCSFVHSEDPFLWQYFSDGKWKKFKDNWKIEEEFCKPDSEGIQVEEDIAGESK